MSSSRKENFTQFQVGSTLLIIALFIFLNPFVRCSFFKNTSFKKKKGFSIVIEGLDGIGKSTAAIALSKRLNGMYLNTPPKEMQSFRSYFDALDSTSRKAFYMVGNFLAGNKMEEMVNEGKIIVMDRYYASTMSYIIGKNLTIDVPPVGDVVYNWPQKLYKPDCMILLTLPEENRLLRRANRMDVIESEEEKVLRKEQGVSERIVQAYLNFGCVNIPLDVNDTKEMVLNKLESCVVDIMNNNAQLKTE
jgi:thymidylate kinase